MAISNPQKLAKAKYQQEKRTLIAADVSKIKGEFYRESATKLNLSLSMLIQNGVEEYIQNRTSEVVTEKREVETLTAEQRRLLENFARLPKSTRAKFTGLLEEVAAQLKGGEDND